MEAIVKQINDEVASWLKNIGVETNAQMLAEPILMADRSGERTIPAIVDQYGEVNANIFDDRYKVGFYHKLTSKDFTNDASRGYGNAKSIVETANLSMIVYGIRSEILGRDVEDKIVHTINSINGKSVGAVKSVSWDRNQVFASEFSGVQFFLKPNIFLFKINYTISTTHRSC